ncbi:glyoxylate/hydroxypyruvate reductase A [Roseibium aggregatum]|uniref:2-hydroxyacid dehydrogenase n=1 Tax=Stappiaceae TaxID=2821832 RepID=UPI0003B9006C|nr:MULTISPECIES: glyoxylate/hydroxypyruvate reductase A [Stappiaceae]ERP85883.1 2-hydroxyacid dehydrogenase [Labrenzia sp. C1B10]ERS06204.1 2-hydroxyacid dehydrogenase [Labrenzia sp. C1B70]UES54726.1 glyoxylate/hydroxypyruvate reductase A [Roseibium aggregatum]
MRPVVPFVSSASPDERQSWREALPKALDGIADVKPFEDLTEDQRSEARVAIVANPNPANVAALPNLVWVQSLWAGVERLMGELPANGPKIVRLTDPQMAETMSEAVLAWTLYLHRGMPRYIAQQRQKVWQDHVLERPQERTVGVLGLGKLGAATALRMKANGFNVLGWSRTEKSIEGIACRHGRAGLLEVLGQSDFIVLLMPLTDETRGLIGQDELSACKKGASIINFARGPIIDTAALINKLDNGPLGHAVLDVFDEEPLPPSSPLWDHDKVTVLPHISAPTIISTASRIVADNIGRYFEDGTVPPAVDRDRGY